MDPNNVPTTFLQSFDTTFGSLLNFLHIQICSGSFNITDREKSEWKQQLRNDINGASEQFIDDFIHILQKTQNNSYAHGILYDNLVSKI